MNFHLGAEKWGTPRGRPGGPKILKIFFSIFFIYLTEIGQWMSKWHEKMKISPMIGNYECICDLLFLKGLRNGVPLGALNIANSLKTTV